MGASHEPLLVHLRRSIKLIRNLNRMDGTDMNRRESFEAAYAQAHDLPIETFSQYRMGDTYRLPLIAKCWRFWNLALDSIAVEWPDHYEYSNSDVAGAAILDCRTAFQMSLRLQN